MSAEERESIGPVTILGFRAESLKRLHVVKMTPPSKGQVRIVGPNEAGKSSVLDTITLVLKGPKAGVEMPIHRGATEGEGELDFGEFTAKRTFTEKGQYLHVKRKDGKPARQDFLDSLVGSGLAFDPLEFSRKKGKEQVDMLLQACKLSQDPREIDKERKEAFDKRTEVNRRAKALKARLDAIPIHADVPEEEIPATEAIHERDIVVKAMAERQALVNRISEQTRRIEEQREVLRQLQQELRTATAKMETFAAAAVEMQATLDAMPEPTMADADKKLAEIEAVNAKVRLMKNRKGLVTEYDALVKEADDLTASIEWSDSMKANLLAEASLPIEGLNVEEGGITINGIPLNDCSASQVRKLGTYIAMALNPTIRVILLRDASLFDQESLEEVCSLAEEKNYQVWCEIVGTDLGEQGGFLLCEGELANA